MLIAGLLAMTGCDDGDPTGGTPADAEIRDIGGQGGMGGMPQGGEGGGGAGGEAGMGGEGGAGGGGAGGEAGMGGGGAGGQPDMGMPPAPACSDEVDNDDDGLIDLDDPGCEGPEDDDETDPPVLCANGVDDDDDGLTDLDDPGCTDGADFTEEDGAERPACANDADDDGDGATDFPADVGCQAAGDDDETDEATPRACSNTVDDDEDGLTDYPFDPGCGGPGDNDETDPEGLPACGNGVDDDGDGAIDYPDDNGCDAAGDYDERLICTGNGHQIVDLNAAIAADGYADGTTVDAQATEQGSCGGMAGGEQMFLYQVAEPVARVTFSTLFEQTATPTVIYVRRACAGAEDLACNRGSGETPGTTAVIERPEAGLYYVIVDTSSRMLGAGAFRLTATEEPLPVCDDNLDNDEDGLTDFPNDPGCESADDDDETSPDPLPACADGIDNDGDDAIDFPDDEDCEAAFDDSENRIGCLENPNFILVDNRSQRIEANLAANPRGYSASCGSSANGPEQVILVRVRQPSGLRVEMVPAADGNRFDTVLHMRANTCDMSPEVECNDDGGDGTLSRIVRNNVEPGDYYFFADTYSNDDGGNIGIEVDVIPLGATCENGADDDADGLIDGEDPGCASPDDDDEADPDPPVVAACANGLDDDEDGLIDFMLDPGCTGVGDDDEADPDPAAACANGEDDDEDGLTDFPADPGCASVGDTSEGNSLQAPACANGDDDDDDGLVDLEDPGCAGPGDQNEADPQVAAACANGVDDDEDLLIDFPRDPGCATPGDLSEVDPDMPPACADTLDNDEDGQTDFPNDPGCAFAADNDEIDPDPAPDCSNGEDDDEDGLIDFPDDPGCEFAADNNEINPADCADGLDNDEDGATDLADPGCFGALDDDETDPAEPAACGNGVDDDEDGATDFPDDAQCQGAGYPREDAVCGDLNLPTIHVGQAGGEINFVQLPGGDLVQGNCLFGSEGNETLIVLTLEQTSTVVATFEGEDLARWMRTTCNDPETEVACESGFSDDPISMFRAPPGEYYFFVESDNGEEPGPVRVNFDIEPLVRICADGEDNDGDGLVDFNDPGCVSADDQDEADPDFVSACNDDLDNDEDGAIDMDDVDCTYAGGTSETALCPELDVDLIEVNQAGGTYQFVLADGDGATEGSCDIGGAKEQAFAVTFNERSHLSIAVDNPEGPAPVVIYARSQCANPGSEVGCVPDFPANGRLGMRNLEAGTYYVFVERASFRNADLLTATITVESAITECNDEVDNDDDGLIDLLDPGCPNGDDNTEADPPEVPTCADGLDNDEDGLFDYPDDFGCAGAGDDNESLACEATDDVVEVNLDLAAGPLVFEYNTANREGLFNATCGSNSESPEQVYAIVVPEEARGFIEITDGAGRDTTLHMRSVCDDINTQLVCDDDGGAGLLSRINFQRLAPGIYYIFADGFGDRAGGAGTLTIDLVPVGEACADGVDNDGDSLIDLDDPGCEGPDDDDEFNDPLPACSNRLDDDGDGRIDLDDPGCDGPEDDDEVLPPACGNGVIEGAEDCDDGNLEDGDGCTAGCALEAEPEQGALRLKDGPAPDQGRLEVYANGAWGSVCDDGWEGDQALINADVACQQLGFPGARAELDGPAADDAVPTHLDEVRCVGDEERLIDCPANAIGDENCGHGEDVGLRCLAPGQCRINSHCGDGETCIDGQCGQAQCGDGEDNDEDGAIDFPDDPGCVDSQDNDETNPACNDELDNDEDGAVDLNDPGCEGLDDDDETDPGVVPACADDIDNDEDGVTDYPADDDCTAAGDITEGPQCNNGIDDDNDGRIDADDFGCEDAEDDDEFLPVACGNGIIEGAEGCDDGNLENGDGCNDACVLEAEPEEGTLRLIDGPAPDQGRLEIYAAGAWGSVCDDEWDGDQAFINADIACQQLGFVGAREELDGPAADDAVPIHLDNVECVGDEERLIDCPANAIGDENCGHGEDIGLRCLNPGECRINNHCDGDDICIEGRCGVAQCADEVDNDEDGAVDLNDPGCVDAQDNDETNPACNDELDNDEDGLIDLADPGCIDLSDDDETDPPVEP